MFVIYFSLNMLSSKFLNIFTQKWMNHTYLLSIYTRNTTMWYFHLYVYFGFPTINRMFFVTFKPLNMLEGTLFVVCLRLNTSKFLRFFVGFDFFLLLIFRFLNAKYVHCSVLAQSPVIQFLSFGIISLKINMLFLSVSCILTWKRINHTYLLAIYTLNTSRTPYFFVYNRCKDNIYLSCCPLVFKTSIIPFLLRRNFWISYKAGSLLFLSF